MGKHSRPKPHHTLIPVAATSALCAATVVVLAPAGVAQASVNFIEPSTNSDTNPIDVSAFRTVTSVTSCSRSFYTTALVNITLQEVRYIQTSLNWNLYNPGPVDGQYGPLTSAAVLRYQQDKGLEADGVVGPQTWASLGLGDWCSVPAPVATPVVQTSSGAQTAVAFALAQLGEPYAFGGNGPDVWDCSGLMVAAARAGGRTLPRTTFSQINSGYAVSVNNLMPGDLVFANNVGHVGMYIGNGQIVHAPHSGDVVKISPLNNGYNYAANGARRIF